MPTQMESARPALTRLQTCERALMLWQAANPLDRRVSMRRPFAVVIANKDRLSVAGSAELLASLLPEHSPNAIIPAAW